MRSIWKGPFIGQKILKFISKNKKNGFFIKVWQRGSSIVPNFVGTKFHIYNGRIFFKVIISEYMIGKKLGEFSKTRKFIKHAGNKKQ